MLAASLISDQQGANVYALSLTNNLATIQFQGTILWFNDSSLELLSRWWSVEVPYALLKYIRICCVARQVLKKIYSRCYNPLFLSKPWNVPKHRPVIPTEFSLVAS